jgi:hypothetical protein
MSYAQMSPEKQQEIDTLIAYLDGLLSAPRGFNRYQTANLRDRLDAILDRPKAQPKLAVVKTEEIAPLINTDGDDLSVDEEDLDEVA